MRPVESESEWRGVRNQVRAGSRAARARRARLRQASLEFLESRTLLATLPPVTVNGQTDISSGATDQSGRYGREFEHPLGGGRPV